MRKQTIWEKIKEKLSGVFFKLFLWSVSMTAEDYWDHIYQIESYQKEEL